MLTVDLLWRNTDRFAPVSRLGGNALELEQRLLPNLDGTMLSAPIARQVR